MKYWEFEKANPPGRSSELAKQIVFGGCVALVVVLLVVLLQVDWVRNTWLYAGLFFAGFVWLIVAQVYWGACALTYGAVARSAEDLDSLSPLLEVMPRFKSRVLSPNGEIRDDAGDLWVDDLLVEVPGWARAAMDVLPPLFTAVGILFTFIGLSEGLSSVNLVFDGASAGTAADESQRLLNDMQGLLGGIKTAFHSSIFGVLLSGFALYAARRFSAVFEDRAAALRDAFSATIESSQRQLLLESKMILAEMRELSRENASKLGQLVSDLPGAISRALAPSFHQLESTLAPRLDGISNSITGLAQSAVDAQQEALQQVMATFLASFNDNLSEQFAQLSTTLTRTLQWHEATRELYDQLLEQLKSGVGTQTQFIHSLETISIQQGEMQERYDRSLEEQKGLLNNLSDEIRQLGGSQLLLGEKLNLLATSLGNIEELAASFDALEGKLATHLENLGETFAKALEWQAAALRSQTESNDRTAALLESLATSREAQTELLDSFGGTVEAQRELAALQREQLDSQQSIVDSLSEVAAVFEDGQDEFTEAQRQMQEALQSNIKILNRTRSQLDTLSTETDRLLDSALAKFDHGTAEVTNRFSGTLIKFGSQLESLDQVLDTLVETLQRLDDAKTSPVLLHEPSSASAKPKNTAGPVVSREPSSASTKPTNLTSPVVSGEPSSTSPKTVPTSAVVAEPSSASAKTVPTAAVVAEPTSTSANWTFTSTGVAAESDDSDSPDWQD